MKSSRTPSGYKARRDAYRRLQRTLYGGILGVAEFIDITWRGMDKTSAAPNPSKAGDLKRVHRDYRERQTQRQIARIQPEIDILKQYHRGLDIPSGVADIILKFHKKNLTDNLVRGILNEMRIPNE